MTEALSQAEVNSQRAQKIIGYFFKELETGMNWNVQACQDDFQWVMLVRPGMSTEVTVKDLCDKNKFKRLSARTSPSEVMEIDDHRGEFPVTRRWWYRNDAAKANAAY